MKRLKTELLQRQSFVHLSMLSTSSTSPYITKASVCVASLNFNFYPSTAATLSHLSSTLVKSTLSDGFEFFWSNVTCSFVKRLAFFSGSSNSLLIWSQMWKWIRPDIQKSLQTKHLVSMEMFFFLAVLPCSFVISAEHPSVKQFLFPTRVSPIVSDKLHSLYIAMCR